MAIQSPIQTWQRDNVSYYQFHALAGGTADTTDVVDCIGAKFVRATPTYIGSPPVARTYLWPIALVEQRLPIFNASWVESTKRLTATNAFTRYTETQGGRAPLAGNRLFDKVEVFTGKETTPGLYRVNLRVGASTIQLENSISNDGKDILAGVLGNLICWKQYDMDFEQVGATGTNTLPDFHIGSFGVGATPQDATYIANPPPFMKFRNDDGTCDVTVEVHR